MLGKGREEGEGRQEKKRKREGNVKKRKKGRKRWGKEGVKEEECKMRRNRVEGENK